ncbi:uncharacterized protein F5147DRAFT_779855 [Suillus discolor]|uniref:Uncharacterized protein n=1 Tax=Suillus discolor TaxID=1912936 RepID=A0A9P7JN52_9AGAM|nr:uncharacterized protein F5147DRAFT_779855 [Suillus discolor]KAG2091807.1 hypothetical protein F5147DRAFT_779855 [Suillus discolor]
MDWQAVPVSDWQAAPVGDGYAQLTPKDQPGCIFFFGGGFEENRESALAKMQQSLGPNFKLQGHDTNLNLPNEIAGNTDGREEEVANHGVRFIDAIINHLKGSLLASDVVYDNCHPNQTPFLPVREHETSEEVSMASLKERLQCAELGCLMLGELCQKYRVRWLEQNYRAMVLEEYAPPGIDTCSPHQMMWDTPSPIQSDVEDEWDAETS